MDDEARYVLLGGGMAADAAARGIRREDPDGSILLLTSEPHPPYDRPPLSKGLWKGDDEERIWRGTEELGVDLRTGVVVEELDRDSGTVRDSRGRTFGFERLLLATGARPRRLTGDDPGVLYFRTLEDFRRLRSSLEGADSVALIGGGFIGCELAASLAGRGLAVTQFFPEDGPMGLVLPVPFSEHLGRYLERHGVVVRSGSLVVGTRVEEGGVRLVLEEGGEVGPFSAVVAGLGVIPRDELAGEAGLAVDDGILVDESLCTGDDRIFAAGDVARFPVPFLGGRHRVEHEEHANESGVLAGRGMGGASALYDPLPYVYSGVGDLVLELVGLSEPGARWDWRTPSEPEGVGVARAVADDRVVAALVWNRPGRASRIKQALRTDRELDLDALTAIVDPSH